MKGVHKQLKRGFALKNGVFDSVKQWFRSLNTLNGQALKRKRSCLSTAMSKLGVEIEIQRLDFAFFDDKRARKLQKNPTKWLQIFEFG